MAANQARGFTAGLVGAPIGGLLYSAGRFLPFAVDAVSFGLSCLSISRIRTPLGAPTRRGNEQETPTGGMATEIAEGLRFIWSNAFLRIFLIYAAIANAVGAAFFVVLTLSLVQADVHPAAIGLIDTVAAGAGIAGAAVAPTLTRRVPTGWLAIGAAWAWVPATLPMPYTTNVAIIGSLLAIGVLLNPVGNAALSSYRIAITPDRLQGRAQTAMNFTAMLAMPLGPLMGGVVMGALGATVTLNLVIAVLALAALLLTGSRAVRSVPLPGAWPGAEEA